MLEKAIKIALQTFFFFSPLDRIQIQINQRNWMGIQADLDQSRYFFSFLILDPVPVPESKTMRNHITNRYKSHPVIFYENKYYE